MDEAWAPTDRADPNDPRLIRHLDSQVAYLMVAGRYSEARTWFDQSLAIFNEHPDRAPLVHSIILSNLGDFYMEQEDWKNPESPYREALRIQENVLGENHAVAASSAEARGQSISGARQGRRRFREESGPARHNGCYGPPARGMSWPFAPVSTLPDGRGLAPANETVFCKST
jgi:tetratricopeptide (TPR) repeat protein